MGFTSRRSRFTEHARVGFRAEAPGKVRAKQSEAAVAEALRLALSDACRYRLVLIDRGAEGAVVREDAHAAQGPGDDGPRRPAPGPGRGELVLRRRHAQLRRVDAHLHGGPRGARASSAHVPMGSKNAGVCRDNVGVNLTWEQCHLRLRPDWCLLQALLHARRAVDPRRYERRPGPARARRVGAARVGRRRGSPMAS